MRATNMYLKNRIVNRIVSQEAYTRMSRLRDQLFVKLVVFHENETALRQEW